MSWRFVVVLFCLTMHTDLNDQVNAFRAENQKRWEEGTWLQRIVVGAVPILPLAVAVGILTAKKYPEPKGDQ